VHSGKNLGRNSWRKRQIKRMALFGNKKKEKRPAITDVSLSAVPARSPVVAMSADLSGVLVKPRITEKATDSTARGVYVFEVTEEATKPQIAEAVWQIYKVRPAKIRIARFPHKVVRNARTGKYGVKSGGRKAYVYLKPGESISIM